MSPVLLVSQKAEQVQNEKVNKFIQVSLTPLMLLYRASKTHTTQSPQSRTVLFTSATVGKLIATFFVCDLNN